MSATEMYTLLICPVGSAHSTSGNAPEDNTKVALYKELARSLPLTPTYDHMPTEEELKEIFVGLDYMLRDAVRADYKKLSRSHPRLYPSAGYVYELQHVEVYVFKQGDQLPDLDEFARFCQGLTTLDCAPHAHFRLDDKFVIQVQPTS